MRTSKFRPLFLSVEADRTHATFTALPSNIFTRLTESYVHCSHHHSSKQEIPFSFPFGHLGNPDLFYLGLHSATRRPLFASPLTRSCRHYSQHGEATGDSLKARQLVGVASEARLRTVISVRTCVRQTQPRTCHKTFRSKGGDAATNFGRPRSSYGCCVKTRHRTELSVQNV